MSRISDKLAAAKSRKVTNTNTDHALIKQLGEALVEAIRLIDASTEPPLHNAQIFTAEAAFNHWKKGQS